VRESPLKCGHVTEVPAEVFKGLAVLQDDGMVLEAWCKRCKRWVKVLAPEFERIELF